MRARVNGWIHVGMVRVGDWALRRWYGPMAVYVTACVVIALASVGLLELMEIISGRQR